MQFTTILTMLSLSVSAMATSLPIAGDSLATRQNCCAAFDFGGKCFCEGGCADCNGDTSKRAVEARQDCCAAFKLGGKCFCEGGCDFC